jgi:uncharacterized surface protein with fasciclin (FAS1) repeats
LRKLLILLALMFAAVTPGFAQEETTGTIADVVAASAEGETPEFTTLLAAVQAADASVLETLSNPEAEYTVFAPTDEAFTALGEEALNAILADSEALTNLLLYHVVEGKLLAADLTALNGQTVTTLQGEELSVTVEEDTVFVNGAEVTTADIEAANGVIHGINAVLVLPEPAEVAGEATAEVPAEPQGTLVPEIVVPGTIADTVLQSAANAEAPEFTYLLAAIFAADPAVVQTLSDESASLTVFAPTDAAFAELMDIIGADEFTMIIADQQRLTDLLLYHVLDGQHLAADVAGMSGQSTATLLEGQSLQITTDEGGNVLVNGIQVLTTDIQASNGVIHVINGVLVPETSGGESS